MKTESFSQSFETIAKSSAPFAVVFDYDSSSHQQGEVLSTHKTYNLARAAARKSGLDSFLLVRDARDFI